MLLSIGTNAVEGHGFGTEESVRYPAEGRAGPKRSGMSALGEPVLIRQEMPFNTLRSSARGTPRGLFGRSGWIIDPSKSHTS